MSRGTGYAVGTGRQHGERVRLGRARRGARWRGGLVAAALVTVPLLAAAAGLTPPAAAHATTAPGARTASSGSPGSPASSAEELGAVKQRLDQLARDRGAPPEVTAWWADPPTRSVVLALNGRPRDGRAAAFVGAARRLDPAVRVVDGVAPVSPRADLVGGDAIFIGDGRCSVGFGARTPAGAPRMITAGHCTAKGGDVRGANDAPIGPIRSSVFDRNGDWGVVDVGPGWSPTSAVAGAGSAIVRVTGQATATPGTDVCRSGSTTGWHCGKVTALDVTANYATGPVEGLVLTSACSEPGDSGGSFVAGSSALGTLSGGSGDCVRPGGTTLYQPIGEVLRAEGLQLVTS